MSQLTKGKLWFDDDMKPQMDGLREVLTEMEEVAPYIHPGSWSMIWTDCYATFANGEFGYNFSWTSMGKYSQSCEISKVCKYVGSGLPPGTPMTAAAAPHPHTSAMYGEKSDTNPTPDVLRCGIVSFDWDWHVATYGQHPELAYLFAQWFVSPKQSTVNVVDLSAYFEPFRNCHWMSPMCIDFYNPEFMLKEYQNLEWTAPGPFIPGGAEYSDIYDKSCVAVMAGDKTIDAAIKEITESWNDITDRLGKESQREAWVKLKESGGFGYNMMQMLPNEFKGMTLPPRLPPYKVAHVPGSQEYFDATRE
jgi:multiple sugar transport system substrate-binding protein